MLHGEEGIVNSSLKRADQTLLWLRGLCAAPCNVRSPSFERVSQWLAFGPSSLDFNCERSDSCSPPGRPMSSDLCFLICVHRRESVVNFSFSPCLRGRFWFFNPGHFWQFRRFWQSLRSAFNQRESAAKPSRLPALPQNPPGQRCSTPVAGILANLRLSALIWRLVQPLA